MFRWRRQDSVGGSSVEGFDPDASRGSTGSTKSASRWNRKADDSSVSSRTKNRKADDSSVSSRSKNRKGDDSSVSSRTKKGSSPAALDRSGSIKGGGSVAAPGRQGILKLSTHAESLSTPYTVKRHSVRRPLYIGETRQSQQAPPRASMTKQRTTSTSSQSSTNSLFTGESESPELTPQPQPIRRRCVRFDVIVIREYARTIGDNPSCSSGPPVT
jgi:hypothetical protein